MMDGAPFDHLWMAEHRRRTHPGADLAIVAVQGPTGVGPPRSVADGCGSMHLVVARSPVRYARVAGVSLAYQIVGDGPVTIVAIPPMAQNIELMWERPEYERMLDRLGAFSTLVHFDKRGTGASDRTVRMPTIDERVEDLQVVMDAAGVDRAHLLGVSEGGPVALAFAATYPDRVEAVVLVSSAARIVGDESEVERTARRALFEVYVDRWGTAESLTLDVFAPTAAADPTYRAWEPRYERQSATPAALRELLDLLEVIDVRPLLPAVTAPVLVLHRRDDPIVPVALAREVAAGIPSACFVELDGVDHPPHVGDVDAWLDRVEEFTTGRVGTRTAAARPARRQASIRTMGGFAVRVDGAEVPLTAWGSRQSRQLCKRLAVAVGQPVPRDELIELLWPDEPGSERLGARLSVVLSHIRRVLGGGLVADRSAVRMDLGAVTLDLADLYAALERGDDGGAVARYTGALLPEDAYEDWAIAARERLLFAVVGAHHRLAVTALDESRPDDAIAHASAILEVDAYDERAHELLVRTLLAAGRRGDAARADEVYQRRMDELGVRPRSLLDAGASPTGP